MARPKGIKKANVNTTVNKEVYKDFHDACSEIGCPMNIVIESLMNQFSSGKIKVEIGRPSLIVDHEQ